MTAKSNLFVAIASVMLATSCSENQDVMGVVNLSNQTIQINPSVGHPSSRAVETNVSNLGSFRVSAFQGSDANYMDKVLYSYKDGVWTTDAGKFFWPMDGDLHFYAYAPEVPGATDAPGTYEITSSSQKLANFSPCASAAEQKDFVYAYAKGNLTDNGTSGMDVDFKHALTEVSIAAKNDNSAYTVEVTGVKLGNIKSKGTFSFPAVGGTTPASWDLSGSGVATYTTTWTTASKLGKAVSSLDASNVAFMLLPQQLATNSKASAGSCIALKVKITMQGGEVLHNDWAYIGIDTNWEMGKHYTYTLDFTSGAGQDEAGKMIISGKDVKLSVNIGDWTAEDMDIPENNTLPELPTTANCLILDPTGDKVGKIDVANNINIFWSNPDVGDAANVLDKKSEWVAEVIWQDINSRAINFCNADGNVISGDTYKGIGNQPLYVKAVGGKKGNVVVGVKKKGAGNDAYLWSWHLWITEEPQLVGGFMDRNLGATSATPSDGNKTYGLYYQFGRKDPFTRDIDRYDINGTSIGKTTVTSGKVTFAKAMQTPAVFYTYGSGNYDWASPNNYISKKWNDITDADGKSLFDPSPKGWRLPNRENFSNFSSTTFTWDNSNNGRTYEDNWFPAAGTRDFRNGGMNGVGRNGFYWSSSPCNGNYGYNLFFDSGSVFLFNYSDRALGFSVRCVQE